MPFKNVYQVRLVSQVIQVAADTEDEAIQTVSEIIKNMGRDVFDELTGEATYIGPAESQ